MHELWELLNGMLCGLVAITPCCATVTTWGSVIIGASSIYAYLLGMKFIRRYRIDDVVDAFPVHGCCGIYGTICAAVFSTQELCDAAYGVGRIDFRVGHQLGVQLLSCITSIALAAGVQAALFLAIKYTVGIRVSEADERVGLDFKYHAGYAYPDFNQRVKKAHEQIALESEIAAQVRKDMMNGKASKFKGAIHSGTILPIDERQMKEKAAGARAASEKDGSSSCVLEKSISLDRRAHVDSPTNAGQQHNTHDALTTDGASLPICRLFSPASTMQLTTPKGSSRSPMASPVVATHALQLEVPTSSSPTPPPGRALRGMEMHTAPHRNSQLRLLGSNASSTRSDSAVSNDGGSRNSVTGAPHPQLLGSTQTVNELG